VPARGGSAELEPEISLLSEGALDVRLDLIAHFKQPDGTVVAISFRPESLGPGKGEGGALNWSQLSASKRISLTLLEDAKPVIAPRVYSGEDAEVYNYLWSRDAASLPAQAAELKKQRDAFGRGDFSSEPTKFGCDRCRVRASCPHWIGALESE
jgi:hypothetical protein